MPFIPSRPAWILGLLLLAPAASHAAEGTLWVNVFGPGTDLPAQPQPAKVLTQATGEVGVRVISSPLLGFRFTGSINTFLQPPDMGRFSLNAASVHYQFGFVRPLGPNLNLTYVHGSWHILDATGFIPKYNKLGVELGFGTSR